jgi:hypothetical protein
MKGYTISLLLIGLVNLLSCNQNKEGYNFTYNINEGWFSDKTLVKGNVTQSFIPSGKFTIYKLDGKTLQSEGYYKQGIKNGVWRYFQVDTTYQISWVKNNDVLKYEIPVLDNWEIKGSEKHELYAFELNQDSLIVGRYSIALRDWNKSKSDFEGYCKQYSLKLEEMGLSAQGNYAPQFSSVDNSTKLWLQEYKGQDNSGDDIIVYSALLKTKYHQELLELNYVKPYKKAESSFRVFTEILMDLHYQKHPIFIRWGLKY